MYDDDLAHSIMLLGGMLMVKPVLVTINSGYRRSLWALIKLIKKRIGIIQGGGLKFCLKLYGTLHI